MKEGQQDKSGTKDVPAPKADLPGDAAPPIGLDTGSGQPISRFEFAALFRAYSGPLPAPEVLEHYERIVPGIAKDIFKLTKTQMEHRHRLEAKVIDSDIHRSKYGLWVGGFLCFSMILGAVICILNGHDTAGASLGVSAIVGVATVFIYGTERRRKERMEKVNALTERLRPPREEEANEEVEEKI